MDSSAVTAIECLDAFVDVSLLVNGVYDVVCAFSILWLPASRLGRLHLHVFKETETPAANRIFAYWVLTYGLDLIIAGAYTSPATDAIAVLSYLMESVTHYNESSVFDRRRWQGKFRVPRIALPFRGGRHPHGTGRRRF